MAWRHELKYLIDEPAFQQLYFCLRPILHLDRNAVFSGHDGIRGYHIRSLYFDNADRKGIFEKLAGVDRRHKFRIRIYNDDDRVIHLEKKSKQDSLAQKQSCMLSRGQVDELLGGNPEALLEDRPLPAANSADTLPSAGGADLRQWRRELQLINQFYAEIRSELLAPALLVDYERLPLTWPDGNVRITFDRNLSTGHYRQDLWDPESGLQPVLEPGSLIMEVKFDHFLPDFIRGLISMAGTSPLSLSKYAQCAGFIRTHAWEDQT